MSLFPAYLGNSEGSSAQSTADTEWLTNSSFAVTFPSQPPDKEPTESTSIVESKRKPKKKQKRSKKKGKSLSLEIQKQEVQFEENDLYVMDKERRVSYLTVKTLTRPLKPRYTIYFYGMYPKFFKPKKKKIKRYFKVLDTSEGCKEGTLEEETIVSKKTEEFNQKLSNDPHDIATWIEFVKFQDEFYKYQHIKYNSLAERNRACSQHKLAILDKAVTQNPDNKELQSLWLKIGTQILPSEEMSSRIDKILEQSGGTMTLWLGLMTTTQYSLARCTVPSVTKLYETLLLNFQTVKPPNLRERDLNVLELLLHYGRFLDNSGNWETLWLMIKVNLQFNTKIDLNFKLKIEDDKVKQLENKILEQEKQAVWQLWNQLERLREGFHFLPEPDSVDYPLRSVSPESVVNFTWHFHPNLHFNLIFSFILLLKVPLLPLTDTVLKLLVPNALPWIFDSPEYILSSVLTSPAVSLQYSFLRPLPQLSRGPQYLRKLHGQLEFLTLINNTFDASLKCLEGRQKVALGVWWLRFERWINLLVKLGLASLPEGKKSAKNFFKTFLKEEENRDNLLYYVEYSLLEFNQGNTDSCVKTLKTLLSSRPPVLQVSDKQEKETLMCVYRTLCEVLVGTNHRKDALDLLLNIGSGNPADAKVTIHLVSIAESKFEQLSLELIQDLNSVDSCSIEDLVMPVFAVDWISCYFWLVALLKSPSELKACFNKLFSLLESHDSIMATHIRECLGETFITISGILEKNYILQSKDIFKSILSTFPRNLRILSFMANSDLQSGSFYWTLKKSFHCTPTVFSSIFLICVALERFQEEVKKDKQMAQNKMRNYFKNLTLEEGKLSSIIHCLRLRYLYEYESHHLETAQLQAIESCPWNKSVYMESILLLPAKLMQLTDVLIEKELRIHITPDEIQEMRD